MGREGPSVVVIWLLTLTLLLWLLGVPLGSFIGDTANVCDMGCGSSCGIGVSRFIVSSLSSKWAMWALAREADE